MDQPKKVSDTTRAAFGERKKTTAVRLRDLNPALFREFATECVELAQSTQSPERRALFLEMSSMWQQMAQRWAENG